MATGRCSTFAVVTVILVDDGLATGSTMRAAIKALRQDQPKAIIVAVPVAAADTCRRLRERGRRHRLSAHARRFLRRRASGTRIFPKPPMTRFTSC